MYINIIPSSWFNVWETNIIFQFFRPAICLGKLRKMIESYVKISRAWFCSHIFSQGVLCSVLATRTGVQLLRDLPPAHTWQFELQHWISKVQWASFQLHCHLARYKLAKDKQRDMRCQRQTGWRTNMRCQRQTGWRSSHVTGCQRQTGWRTQSERKGAKPVIANTNGVNEHQPSQPGARGGRVAWAGQQNG